MTTSASRDNCMLGLFKLQPQARKPFRIVFAFLATFSAFSVDINPPMVKLDQADDLAVFHHHLPAADFGQFVGGQGHVLFIRAND